MEALPRGPKSHDAPRKTGLGEVLTGEGGHQGPQTLRGILLFHCACQRKESTGKLPTHIHFLYFWECGLCPTVGIFLPFKSKTSSVLLSYS